MNSIIIRDIAHGDIKLPAGTPVECHHHHFNRMAITTPTGKRVTIQYANAFKYLSGFIEITDEIKLLPLHKGLSKSPTGEEVKVDGYDKYGFPSYHRIILAV